MTSPRYDTVVLQPGDTAPAFDLPAWPSGRAKSEDRLGKGILLLAFYVDDEAPGSVRALRSFSADIAKFEELNCQVLCVSFDSIDSHARAAAANGLSERLLLLSDTTHDTARAYGAVIGDRNLPEQILFLIDKNGLVRHIHKGMPDNSALLQVIAGLY